MQNHILSKRKTQSLDSYKKRLRTRCPENILQCNQQDDIFLGRSFGEMVYLIPPENYVSSLLFPIRNILPSEIQAVKEENRIHLQSFKKDFASIMSGQTGQKETPTKVTTYLFQSFVPVLKILEDPEFTDHEKIQLAHLRKIIHDYLIIGYSYQEMDNGRMLKIINSLESPIGDLPPLSDKEIINVLNVLDYLLPVFENQRKKKLQTIEKQTKLYKQQLNKELEYLPGLGKKYKQAFSDFQNSKKKYLS